MAADTINTLELLGSEEGSGTGAEIFGQTKVDKNSFSAELPLGDPELFEKSIDPLSKPLRDIYVDDFEWDSSVRMGDIKIAKEVSGSDQEYDSEGKKSVNSLFFAEQFKLDPDIAYNTHDELGRQFFDVEDTPEGYFERIKTRFKNGVRSNQMSDEGANLLVDFLKDPSSVDLEKRLSDIQKIQSSISSDGNRELRAWHEKMIGATAEQIPFLLEGAEGGIKGGIAGAASGAVSALVIGLLIPAPEEALTVPAGLLYGGKVGASLGAGIAIGRLEAGSTFAGLMQETDENGNKVDPKLAAITSLGVGAINGGIEVAEWAILLSTFGVGTKLFENAARKVTSKVFTQGTLNKVLAKHIVKFGVTLTAETAQELLQESTSIIGEELAKEINNSRKGTDFEPITGEALAGRMRETAVESLRGFPLLLAPGTAISTGIDVKRLKDVPAAGQKQTEVQEDIKEPEQPGLIKSFQDIPGIKESIEALKEVPPIEDIPIQQVIKDKTPAETADTIIQRPIEISEDGGVLDKELLPEESAAIKRLNAEIEIDEQEEVSPNLYIGNVTQRQKKVFAEELGIEPEDVSGFREGAFPTKRTGIPMTRAEASDLLVKIETSILDRLDKNKVNTENDLARINADWGDVKALRETLELPKTPRPFTVQRAGKHRVVAIESAKERIRAAIQPGVLDDANMTVGQVLNVTLKRVAQAARHAFSIGKKEGIARTKEHFAEVKASEKARKRLKVRINKALKRINKTTPSSVDFFYSEAINRLRKEFDPKKRSKKTLERRQRQRDFLKTATAEEVKDFPQKLFDSIIARPLNDVTIAELEQTAQAIEKLEKLGKTKKRAKDNIIRLRREKNIKQAIKNMAAGKPFPIDKEHEFINAGTAATDLIKTIFIHTLTTPRLLDWLDGAKGTFSGLLHGVFYDRVNVQFNSEMRRVSERHKTMREKADSLGIKDNELIEVMDLSGLKQGLQLYREQMMGIYAALKNRKARDAMLATLRISEKTARAIVSNLDQKFIDLADSVIEDYAKSYPDLQSAHIEFTNQALGVEEFYTPIVRIEKDGRVSENDIVDQLLNRDGLRRTQAEKGFTIERQNIAPQNQKKIDLRLMSIWRSQSQKQEHYISFAPVIKDLNGYLADDKFNKAVNAKLGAQGHKILRGYVDRVANPNVYKGYGTFEQLSRKLRGNMAMAYLAYNLLTVLKQSPSIVLALRESGANSLFSSIGRFVSNPKELMAEVEVKFPQLKSSMEREFDELESANTKEWQKVIRKYGRAGLEGIKFVDRVVKSIVYDAVYQKEMSSHGSEVEARRQAQNAVLRTQPAATAKELSALYTQNEVLNWFLVFTQQLNKIWNIVTYDTYAQWNNKNYQGAATNVLAVALNALVIWMITNKRLPEDEDDLLDMASDQMINIVPIIGKDIMAGKKGWGGAEIAPFAAAKRVTGKIAAGDAEDIAKEFLEQSAVATGVPVVAIKRGLQFLETGDPIELIGGDK